MTVLVIVAGVLVAASGVPIGLVLAERARRRDARKAAGR